MRIAFMFENHPAYSKGGAEFQTKEIAEAFKRKGDQALLIALGSHFEESKEEVLNGLRVFHLPRKLRHYAKAERIKEILSDERVMVIYLRDVKGLKLLKKIQDETGIPASFHFYSDQFVLPWRASIVRELTNMYSKFGPKAAVNRIKKGLIRTYQLRAINAFSLCFCQTHTQQMLLNRYFGINAIMVRNGVNLPDNAGWEKEKVVLWVGKSYKNPDLFIRLASMFKDSGYKFVMIGSHGFTTEKVNTYGNFVKILGIQPIEVVFDYLKRSLLLINTSDSEGFPNTFIQAWMYGVPVFSLRLDPDNVLKNHRVGLYLNNFKELVDVFKRLLSNNFPIKDYRQNAIEHVTKFHNIDQNVLIIRDAFQKIIGSSQFTYH